MATVTFSNVEPYPYYSVAPIEGLEYEIVLISKNSTGGSFTFKPNYAHFDLNIINFVLIKEESQIDIYAFIESWERERNGMYTISYKIDALRTFRKNIKFGKQYVLRASGLETFNYVSTRTDPLVKTVGKPKTIIKEEVLAPVYTGTPGITARDIRYVVVQVRSRTYVGGVDVDEGVVPSNNPLNPSQYRLYVAEYQINNPNASFPIRTLLETLRNTSETSNIVTMYSVPFINRFRSLAQEDLIVRVKDKEAFTVTGFRVVGEFDDVMSLQTYQGYIVLPDITPGEPYNPLLGHTAELVTPEGQVLIIPPIYSGVLPRDDADYTGVVEIERIVDLYSGSVTTHIGHNRLTPYSVRSGPLGEITILSDPTETYKANNKNSMAVGLATTAGGILTSSVTGGLSLGVAGAGLTSVAGTIAGIADSGSYSNQPLFLGETIAAKYNNSFFLQITHHETIDGGPILAPIVEKQIDLDFEFKNSLPYIQTIQCSVIGRKNTPKWALDEINNLLDKGLFTVTNTDLL